MRKWVCVPMMALCLLMTGCGGGGAQAEADSARQPYRDMTGCTAQADVTCGTQEQEELTFTLQCSYVPDGKSTVEVLAPNTVAGIKATVDSGTMELTYEDLCLNAGESGTGELSPAACLPRIFSALRDGWLLEENEEKLDGVSCRRLCLDQTGTDGRKILTTVWLKEEEEKTPVRGEISAGDKILLTAEFTDFQFGDILNEQTPQQESAEVQHTAPTR